MDQVILVTFPGSEERKFNLNHAQSILDFQKKNPQSGMWKVSPKEKEYSLVKGILTKNPPVEIKDDPNPEIPGEIVLE